MNVPGSLSCVYLNDISGFVQDCSNSSALAQSCTKPSVYPIYFPSLSEYITEVERTRRAEEQEGDARALFESGNEGAKGLVELWQRVNKEDQLPLYYSGGLRVIKELLVNSKLRMYFIYMSVRIMHVWLF